MKSQVLHTVWCYISGEGAGEILTLIFGVKGLTLSLPRVMNLKFPLQPHQKYYVTQQNLAFIAYADER